MVKNRVFKKSSFVLKLTKSLRQPGTPSTLSYDVLICVSLSLFPVCIT